MKEHQNRIEMQEEYRETLNSTGTFTNPILSGFYPDPSICRVGDDYYMVTSSFVYFPGIPIFHSRDLVHWEQIGHGISRKEQLDYKNCEASLGLWAPTIRYHNGTFYIINTFVSEGREARRDNYIITAERPEGPYSIAHFIKGADGIDSSLFFDEDGRIYYTGNFICDEKLYEGHHGIYLCELDAKTLQFKGKRTVIWDGARTGSKWIEAPHLYHLNGYYYLIVAEGGTFTNHSVMMARCRSIDGEYEICPRNPILSHRHLSLRHPISVVGHADLTETQNGEWWMVCLGVRPYMDTHFNTGRETFLLPVIWENDGWLRVDNENGCVNHLERLPDLTPFYPPSCPGYDNFEEGELSMVWNTIHPPLQKFYSLDERPGWLRITLLPEVLHEINTPSFIGRRQQDSCFCCSASMEFTPVYDYELAGLALVQDNRFHYVYCLTLMDDLPALQLYETKNAVRRLVKSLPIKECRHIYLHIQCSGKSYSFAYGYHESERIPFTDNIPASLLSSITNEGFTGVYIGMYATANHRQSENYADFDWFSYK